MDYSSTMQTVADLIRERHLTEARSLLNMLVAQYPGDQKARRILQTLEGASTAVATTDLPMPEDFHDTSSGREVLRQVKQALSQLIHEPWRTIPDDRPLGEYGLDSLGLIELSFELEEAFGIEIDEDVADELLSDPDTVTVRQIAEVIGSR
jgi:acyl carrier protein